MQGPFRIVLERAASVSRQRGIIVKKMYKQLERMEGNAHNGIWKLSFLFSLSLLPFLNNLPFFSYQCKVLTEKMKCIHAFWKGLLRLSTAQTKRKVSQRWPENDSMFITLPCRIQERRGMDEYKWMSTSKPQCWETYWYSSTVFVMVAKAMWCIAGFVKWFQIMKYKHTKLQTIAVELELENWHWRNWYSFYIFLKTQFFRKNIIVLLLIYNARKICILKMNVGLWYDTKSIFLSCQAPLPLLPAPFSLHFANWCSKPLLRWPSISFPALINGLLWIDGRLEEKEIILDNVDTVFISCHPIKLQLSQVQERRKVERMAKEWESEAPWDTLYQTH